MASIGGRTNNSFSFSNKETDVERLQKEVDSFTKRLEQEKRRLFTVEEGYQTTNKEYIELVKKTQKKVPASKVEKKQQSVKIHSLSQQLEQAIVKLNQIIAENGLLRRDVDVIRRERVTMNKVRRYMGGESNRVNNMHDEASKKYRARSAAARNIKEKIVALREKNEEEQSVYLKHYEDIQRELKQDQKKLTSMAKPSKSKVAQDNFETQSILKRRLQRIILNNKEKVDVIDQYQRNMKMIDEAFNIIKETSGITDIEEIMNTFIKSEEQNYSLFNYVNILTQDIDLLEESNKDLQEEIKITKAKIEEKKEKDDQTPQEEIEREQITQLVKEKDDYITDVRLKLKQIRPSIEKVLLEIQDTEFRNTDTPVIYKDFVFDETTAESYLSILEGSVDRLIPYISKVHDVRDFMTTGLLLEEFPDKIQDRSMLPNIKDISTAEESNLEFKELPQESFIRDEAIKSVNRYIEQNSFNLSYSHDVSKLSHSQPKKGKF